MGCLRRVRFLVVLCAGVVFANVVPGSGGTAAAAAPVEEVLRQKIEDLRWTGRLDVGNASIGAVELLPVLYEQRQFRPAWLQPGASQELLAIVEASEQHGLDPADFHLAELKRLQRLAGDAADPTVRAEFDLLMTDSLIRLAYQLRYGKIDPERGAADWSFNRPLFDQDPAEPLSATLADGRIAETLAALQPAHPIYGRLMAGLKQYRGLQAAGGWPRVPAGPALEPGAEDERVRVLRRRLQASGELKPGKDGSIVYDEALAAAVRRFQGRHGLAADGVIAGATLDALNVPVAARIEQIRVNLERARWVLHDLGRTFVAVNIASFSASLIRDGTPAWQARVIVGKPYRETPSFRSEITYLVFNPTWTVPPTIFREDVLPKLKRDPSYLARNNFELVDRSGQKLSAAGIDWSTVSAKTFPHQLVQPPGKKNPLGRVKFMFPNKHQVYLHDTPDKRLFERSSRTFSSGCIRVERPLELAGHLLAGEPQWSKPAIERLMQASKTRTVFLTQPVPILLLYWTVEADPDGGLRFNPDIYGRDRAVATALGERYRPVTQTANDVAG